MFLLVGGSRWNSQCECKMAQTPLLQIEICWYIWGYIGLLIEMLVQNWLQWESQSPTDGLSPKLVS